MPAYCGHSNYQLSIIHGSWILKSPEIFRALLLSETSLPYQASILNCCPPSLSDNPDVLYSFKITISRDAAIVSTLTHPVHNAN
jgi:hypothetical protein